MLPDYNYNPNMKLFYQSKNKLIYKYKKCGHSKTYRCCCYNRTGVESTSVIRDCVTMIRMNKTRFLSGLPIMEEIIKD